VTAKYYHAGMKSSDREAVQKSWMQNEIRIVTATSAFGMGIDKSDVRIVIHYDLPDSPEEYFQEAGRAGRDKKESFCVLLYNEGDIVRKRKLFEKSFPELSYIKRTYKALGHFFQLAVGSGEDSTYPFSLKTFCNTYKLEILKTHNALKILEEAGWISLSDGYYKPPTFYFLHNRRELYNYQLLHKENNVLINTLLRNHESPWGAPVMLKDELIRTQLRVSKAALYKLLDGLQRQGLLTFEQATDDPFITFLLPRSASNNLTINQQLFDFRLSLHKKRLESMISYVYDVSCRNHFLYDYFGQEKTKDCQTCDYCLGMHKPINGIELEEIKGKVLNYLQKPFRLLQLIRKFEVAETKKLIETLQVMEEEGNIRIDRDVIYPIS
jgi:ATP-dependent DNA helicase RecQ